MEQLEFDPKDAAAVCKTKLEKETFSFVWEIEDYLLIAQKQPEGKYYVYSAVMRGGPISNHRWSLYFNPKFKKDGVTMFSLFLQLEEFGDGDSYKDRTLDVSAILTILDEKDKPRFSGKLSQLMRKGIGWGYESFCKAKEISEEGNGVLKNGTLKILCRITLTEKPDSQVVLMDDLQPTIVEINGHRKLQFGKLLADSVLADVRIVSGSSSFHAHKAILAASSPVFAAMFTADMAEKCKNSVEISDFNAEVVRVMLDHIYKGETDLINTDNAPDILLASDKYDLQLLKKQSEAFLIANLNICVESAVDSFVLAHTSNSENLKRVLTQFMKRNFEDVKKTESYKKLLTSHLAIALLDLI